MMASYSEAFIGIHPLPRIDRLYNILELEQTDAILSQVTNNAMASGIRPLFSVDHFRLAEEEGEVLDASTVGFCTNAEVNGRILEKEIRSGLEAFAQNVLVCEQEVKLLVIYDEITSIAKLHYQNLAVPHRVIACRLKNTLSSPITVDD